MAIQINLVIAVLLSLLERVQAAANFEHVGQRLVSPRPAKDLVELQELFDRLQNVQDETMILVVVAIQDQTPEDLIVALLKH